VQFDAAIDIAYPQRASVLGTLAGAVELPPLLPQADWSPGGSPRFIRVTHRMTGETAAIPGPNR
jgi:hypothetical protein